MEVLLLNELVDQLVPCSLVLHRGSVLLGDVQPVVHVAEPECVVELAPEVELAVPDARALEDGPHVGISLGALLVALMRGEMGVDEAERGIVDVERDDLPALVRSSTPQRARVLGRRLHFVDPLTQFAPRVDPQPHLQPAHVRDQVIASFFRVGPIAAVEMLLQFVHEVNSSLLEAQVLA